MTLLHNITHVGWLTDSMKKVDVKQWEDNKMDEG